MGVHMRLFSKLAIFIACFSSFAALAAPFAVKGLGDIASMKVREDGSYDVVCKDGRNEVASVADLTAGNVCKPGLPLDQCIQDQYGNKYHINIDAENHYVTGTVETGQSCQSTGAPILGSFQGAWGQGEFEITVPLGGYVGCVDNYKIKGRFAEAAWYYTDGFGGQEFAVAQCGSKVLDSVGALAGHTGMNR